MGSYSHDISFMTVRLTELKHNSSKPSTILTYVHIQVVRKQLSIIKRVYYRRYFGIYMYNTTIYKLHKLQIIYKSY